ncbi:MAG: SDR family NAD(P)-dependent oxidoreductase [Pseudomonadota bacterium]
MTDKRLILVSGASRGIGRAAALTLARDGARIIALARSKKALESLDDDIRAEGGEAVLVPVDLKDADGLDRLAAALNERFGRLDGLLGNAGVLGTLGPLQTVTPASFEETIAVNLTANFRLIRAMDPLLRQSDAPRAVFVTSSVAVRPRAFWGPYQASKAGLEAMVAAWAHEAKDSKLKINIFDPGGTRTGMRAEAMPGEDPSLLPTPEAVAAKLTPLLSPNEDRHGARISFREAP